VLRGELQLPDAEAMEKSMAQTACWKRANMHYEPARAYTVSTRFHQYIDVLLKEIGVSPYRKMPNVFAELFGRYGVSDYRGVTEEYLAKKVRRGKPLPLDT
jgi:dimethylaniline monooxygenase (N-oxide forming)